MLSIKEVQDECEITKWLKWIFELPQGLPRQVVFRSNAREVFGEALPPNYKAAQGMSYYLISNDSIEQLLVKLNWGAPTNTINIAGMVRINKGVKAHVCLNRLIDAIRPICKINGKEVICAKPISPEGRRVLENLSSFITNIATDCDNKSRIFRYQIVRE